MFNKPTCETDCHCIMDGGDSTVKSVFMCYHARSLTNISWKNSNALQTKLYKYSTEIT